MALIAFWAALLVVSAVGLAVSIGRARFQRYVNRAIQALDATTPSREELAPLGELPVPVARYRSLAVGDRAAVKTVVMRHGGTFRTTPAAKVLPIEGTQVFSTDPPAYVWSARVRMAPGLWFDACDTDIAGEGRMRVMIESLIPMVDQRGPEVDQGAALRLLAEMPWSPTAFFDTRYVRWSAIDASHALATLRVGKQDVSCVFEFGPDGLPLSVSADRFRNAGERRPWGGTYRDYRSVAGMRVPFEVEVTWQLESGPYTYAHWIIESVEYNVPDLAPLN
ncbi:MAG: hypothetical protein M3O46_23575 [Myxococcota bacterium]|nr:hypothetical protein [Myxococcota bacterium]